MCTPRWCLHRTESIVEQKTGRRPASATRGSDGIVESDARAEHRLISAQTSDENIVGPQFFIIVGEALRPLSLSDSSLPSPTPLLQALGRPLNPHTPCMDSLGWHKLNQVGSSNSSEHEFCFAWHESRRVERTPQALAKYPKR